MAIYDLGTASLAANGEVTGVGTTWKAPLTLIRAGATIVFKTEPVKIYTISEIISDTHINVYNPNSETVPAGTGYAILAHDGITVQGLAQDVAETLRYYQSRETEVSAAVDIFKDFDQDKFSNDVNQVNTQYGEIVTIGSQVSSDASQVSADKDAAYASSISAQNSANIAKSAAESVSGALVGNFDDGVTLQSKNQVIIQFINGYARQFVWSGSFPKIVPAGSTPESTGGVGSGAWVSVSDASLRGQLGSLSGLTFNTVGDIFTGTTSSGQKVTLKVGDTVTTGGGTQWRILFASPSAMSEIKATSPFNVIDFGADPSGYTDSTEAFVSAGGCSVPEGTYIVNDNLSGIYYKDGRVTIKGNGTVKLISKDTQSSLCGTPYDIDATPGGVIYPSASSSFSANSGEYLRLPVMTRSPYGGQTFIAYAVLVGNNQDIGKNATQTSRIEVRSSTNNYSFGSPITISTEGQLQASEPAIVFDKKRGRLWAAYATASGRVGIGYGSVGYSPDSTLQTWITYANTYGTAWSTPINITSFIKPYNANSAWVPPSELCVTAEGDLILPYSWYINSEAMYYAGYIRITEDETGSLTYTRHLIARGGPDGSQGTGEHQIVQLGDGSLFCMMRDYYQDSGNTKGRQRFYRSYDGVSWHLVSSIDTSNCKAGMGVFSSTASGLPRNAIMVTAPTGNDNSDLYRNNLKMWISGDYGDTWTEYPTTMFDNVTVSTGYSSVISTGNGAFMVAAEGASYGVINIKHRAMGVFTGSTVYSRSYGRLPVTSNSELSALAASRDIPQYSLYFLSLIHI